jgi:hypothetical protein
MAIKLKGSGLHQFLHLADVDMETFFPPAGLKMAISNMRVQVRSGVGHFFPLVSLQSGYFQPIFKSMTNCMCGCEISPVDVSVIFYPTLFHG